VTILFMSYSRWYPHHPFCLHDKATVGCQQLSSRPCVSARYMHVGLSTAYEVHYTALVLPGLNT